MCEIVQYDPTDLSSNDMYAQYMRIHKVLVGNRGARQLEQICARLQDERMPHYLVAAGWAAAESALVRNDVGQVYRLGLLDTAEEIWRRALGTQEYIEAIAPEESIDYSQKFRTALDLAVLPLMRGIVEGYIAPETSEKVFLDCLNIAELNAVHTDLAQKNRNANALAAHIGLGYECNALLAFNRVRSQTLFVIPAMARSDSGLYHRRQTHDLLVVNQRHGTLRSVTPVEVKSVASARDRARYDALLVRGKMHLSVEGKYFPLDTLRAIAADYAGVATEEERYIANTATVRFMNMARDYYSGTALGKLASRHSVTVFRDGERVRARHPGLARAAA